MLKVPIGWGLPFKPLYLYYIYIIYIINGYTFSHLQGEKCYLPAWKTIDFK